MMVVMTMSQTGHGIKISKRLIIVKTNSSRRGCTWPIGLLDRAWMLRFYGGFASV